MEKENIAVKPEKFFRLLGAGITLLVFLIFMFFATKRVTINPGTEGVMVDHPFFTFVSSGGVRPTPMKVGSQWLWKTTAHYIVNMKPVQYTEQFTDMSSSDNVPVNFSAYPKVRVLDSPKLYEKFGTEWYEYNIREFFRTIVRNLCKKYQMTDLVSNPKVLEAMQSEAKRELVQHAKDIGIPVEVLDVVIGRISPSQEIIGAFNATAVQQQLQKTEKERAAAQVERKNAEEKRADADNAYRLKMGMNPEQFVSLEGIHAFRDSVDMCSKAPHCELMLVPPGTHPTVSMK